MKSFYHFILVLFTILLFSGCVPTPVPAAYSNATFSTDDYVDNNYLPIRKGKAICYSIFSIYAHGNCSVSNAMEDGNITKVHSVEHHNIEVNRNNPSQLLYREYTTAVKGE